MSDIVISLVVSPILQEALSKAVSFATSFARRHIKDSGDLKKQLEELRKSLIMMRSLLEVAEGMKKSHDAVRNWLEWVEDQAYKVVDLLDEYAYAVHQQEVGTKQVHTLSSPFKSMPGKIKEINESLDKIRREANVIKLLYDLATLSQDPIETTPYPSDNSKVLGRDSDVSEVVCLLSDLNRQNRLSGLSIVGMPGVGKTTLARSVYKRAKKENLYDLVAWVCLSENFDEKMILRGMLEYLGSNADSKVNPGALLERLERMLENKRFLLVLDDVWNDDRRRWKSLFLCLLTFSKTTGNSIVVTTSSKQVVASTSAMKEVPMRKYELQKLSDEECRLIMEDKIRRPSTIPVDLLDIAKQCGGLPLVAAVIGEALSPGAEPAHNGDEWLAIRNNTAWDSPHRMEILCKLKKSFDHLPTHLKKCFSYCSIFPKGLEIRRDDLVQLWLATGFLRQSDNRKSNKEEDVGDEYLNDLVSNYLFQDVKMDEYGNIKSCKMHDEVHNLALFISKCEICIWPDSYSHIEKSSKFRHMRVISDANLQAFPKGAAHTLRSLFLEVDDVLCTDTLDPGSLQSLKLAAVDRRNLQKSLDKLKCSIKYLEISDSKIRELPKSITKLYNLQTLRFMGCKSLMELPSGIENLVSLRHMYFDDNGPMPRRIGKLTSLKTLQLFVVGTEEGQKIKELACLNQLRGKLKICNLENVPPSEAREAKLEDKGELINLQFVWSKNRADSNNAMCVLEGLRPNSNLKRLTIENYKGSKFASWMVKDARSSGHSFRLNSLVKLKLIDCDECDDISFLGLLTKLQVLNLRAMPKVQRIEAVFPCLEELLIQDCPELKIWWASGSQGAVQSIQQFPALRKLTLNKMTKLEEWKNAQGMVVFSFLEELHIKDCLEIKTWCAKSSQGRGKSITPFPALRKLMLSKMTKLEEWTEAQDMVVFPSLEELHIEDCQELKTWWVKGSSGESITLFPNLRKLISWWVKGSSGESITLFPNLRKLTLSNMPKLEEWTEAQGRVMFPYLEELHIVDCLELKPRGGSSNQRGGESITPFPALRKLTLSNMKKLEGWTTEAVVMFPCLEELHIRDCLELKTRRGSNNQCGGESITPFPALRKLTLSKIKKLEGWTTEVVVMFPCLEELHIRDCPELETWRAGSSQGGGDSITPFPALRKLTLSNMTKLKEWRDPQGKIVFGCLQELQIRDCPELKTWEIDGSASPNLYILGIHSCPKLQAIPSRLLNLKSLDIDKCPNLGGYAEERSTNWCTICHIPRIRINGQVVLSQES